jgi:two-component system, NtrC family, sensor kinase
MKQKLGIGLVFITLIFIVSGIFILFNLSVITKEQKLKEQHDSVLHHDEKMTYEMESALSELYSFQAGHGGTIDSLMEHVIKLEGLLARARNDYASASTMIDCSRCHSLAEKTGSFNKKLAHITEYLSAYKKDIRLIVRSKDARLTDAAGKEAASKGEEITKVIAGMRLAATEMDTRLNRIEHDAIVRSRYSILAALILSILLSSAVGAFLVKAITRPVNRLIEGIEKVSDGNYDSKVDISSRDEMGFLAQRFNVMTDNLRLMILQRESLLSELNELNRDLEKRVQAATDELKLTHEKLLRNETLSVVGTFASGVAHELATPISSVMSYFQILKKRLDKEPFAEDIGIVEGELQRCKTILRGMLDFARAPEQEKVPADVNVIIRDLLMLLRYQEEYRNVVIREELDPDVPRITAIPGQLKQVFTNIMINALQAMPAGGELSVATDVSVDGRNVLINISDTGSGLSHEEIDRIFQPFYTSKETGTGLGLSISYGIVKGHGGAIEVKSEPGKGTTFLIRLPVGETAHE